MTTIINLFGSSGSGKSTTALGLGYHLKKQGYKVENITEWIKEKIFADDINVVKDQLYIFAKQRRKQFILKDKNLDFIITDSPLLLSAFYGNKNGILDPVFKELIFQEFNKFENLNYFLTRSHPFDPFGRLETEEQSDKNNIEMLSFLSAEKIPFDIIDQKEKSNQIIQLLNLGNIL